MNKDYKDALAHFNAIVSMNEVIDEYHAKTDRTNKLINQVDKETNHAGTLIFSTPINIVLKSVCSETNLIHNLKLNKMEIRYFLDNNRSGSLYGFRLDLTLLSNSKRYPRNIMDSFIIAASKDYNIYSIVCDEEELKIRYWEDHYVKFSSKTDFYTVINLCKEFVSKFNDHIEGQEKLLSHLAVQ